MVGTALATAILVGSALAQNSSLETTGFDLCPGSRVEDPPASWLWSTGHHSHPSCSKPTGQNWGKMCKGDPTSVVIENWGKTSCLSTSMGDCKFNMHHVKQIDFEVRI